VHIDTAQIYGNEAEVGQARKASGKKREKFWLTTKIWIDNYGRLAESFEESLEKLQTEYVDLLLLHRPTTLFEHEKCFDVMMDLQQKGKINHFGVSNFRVADMEHAVRYTDGKIFTNQIEYHLELGQEKVKVFAEANGILITAYSPLGHGHLLKNEALWGIAEKHSVSVAQVCIAWLLQQGCIVIPKASSEERLTENFTAQVLVLDEEDLAVIVSLPKNHRYINPPVAPQWDE
jgi:2,5-diketo-D-gluconate reductase B